MLNELICIMINVVSKEIAREITDSWFMIKVDGIRIPTGEENVSIVICVVKKTTLEITECLWRPPQTQVMSITKSFCLSCILLLPIHQAISSSIHAVLSITFYINPGQDVVTEIITGRGRRGCFETLSLRSCGKFGKNSVVTYSQLLFQLVHGSLE